MTPERPADRPFVVVNMATTVDGKITSAAREYPRLTSAADRLQMDRLRAESDAVLVGAGTLRADRPKLHVRDPAMREHRAALGRPPGLLKVLVSASLALEPEERLLADTDGGGVVVATTEDAPPDRIAALSRLAEVWQLGRGSVDLRALVRRLAERGVRHLLVEGGGELNWAFVEADLVDELYVTVAPALLGGRDAPTLLEGRGFGMREQRRLTLLEVRREGDELFCRWAVVRGSANGAP